MKKGLISISSKLMQNYHVGKPVSAGTQISTFTNTDGNVEVLSIGSDFNLYNFYPDSSDTAWGMKQIKLPNNMKVKEIVSGNMDGAVVVLVKIDSILKGDGLLSVPLLTLTRNGGSEAPFIVGNILKGGKRNGENYVQLPVYPDSISLLSRQLPGGDQLAYTGISIQDGWRFNHQVYSTPDTSHSLANYMSRSTSQINSSALLDYINPEDNKKYKGTAFAVSFDDPTNIYGRVEFMKIAVSSHRKFTKGKENTCSHVATTEIPNAVFAIRSADKALLYMTSHQSKHNDIYENTLLSEITGEDGQVVSQKMANVFGTTDAKGRPVAFAIGEDGFLYHTELKEDKTTWSPLTVINAEHQFSNVSISKNTSGDPIIFAMTATDKLIRIWLDSDPKVDLWQEDEIEIEPIKKEDRKAEEINTYSTEITVFDKAGVLRPNANIKVWSSGSQNLIINGKGFITNSNRPAEVLSNPAGKVSIVSITNDIATSIIHVWTEYMDDDKGIAIQANGAIQDKFSNITADELLDASGKNGQLLKGDDRIEVADTMAEALKSSMAIIEHSAKADAQIEHHNYSRIVSGAKCHHVMSKSFGQRHRINPDQTYTDSWKLSFENGIPVYSNLGNANTAILNYQQGMPILDMEFYGFLDYLSDVWRMIKEGVAELVEIVVYGIKTAVTVLIDGVKKIWRGVINFVDEIFQAVLGFFESVKVFFEDLFHWLGTIFNWQNILRTKEVINYSFNIMLDFLDTSAIQFAKNKMDERIEKLQTGVHEKIHEYLQTIGAEKPLIGLEEQNDDDTHAAMVGSVENNVITNAFSNNYQGADQIQRTNNITLTNAFNKIKPIAEKFDSSENKAWENAVNYFEGMKDNPDKILEFLMAGLLELVEAILVWALEKIKDIMDALFDAVSELIKVIKKVLNSPFYIPVVTEIYNLVKDQEGDGDGEGEGLPFTYLDVASIMIAVPTTVVYTLAMNKAPFPNKESVTSFEQLLTVEWLNQKMGITAPVKSVTPMSTQDMQVINNFFNLLSGIVYSISVIVKPLVDITTIKNNGVPTPGLVVLSGVEAVLNSVGWIASIPWLVEPDEEHGTQGFEVQATIWGIELFDDVLVDWAFFATEPEGPIESITTTILSSVNMVEYIILANIDPKRAYNVSKTLPGVFAIVRPIASITPPYGPPVGMVAMTVIDAVSNAVMAGFSYAAIKKVS